MRSNKLTKNQREAIGLLSIGTFLEYFDLMLYVHMAVLLNDLFFPKDSVLANELLAATAFCLTYLLRPIAGFIIGSTGDFLGRKFTIMLTTFIMAASCLIMANLKTYAEIGLTASVGIIICRMLQGFSSVGELMGAQLYITEILKTPYRCFASGIVIFGKQLGGVFALVVASFAISSDFNWRLAFWIGAGIALIGVLARTRLREASEFTDYKRRMKNIAEQSNQKTESIKNSLVTNEKTDKKAVLAFFFTEFHIPICFYITYMYLGDFMKKTMGMTPEQVINQNLKVSIFVAIGALIIAFIVKKIHPIKIAIITAVFFVMVFPFIPYWIENVSSLASLLLLQCIIFSIGLSTYGTLDGIQY
ncbi:MAG: MHS family proline/betaine transporter-like MFS transporter [Candidatus Midichloriaceae bacterium]|jgi:MHS family proline/betaine transporter-like MFS transporter